MKLNLEEEENTIIFISHYVLVNDWGSVLNDWGSVNIFNKTISCLTYWVVAEEKLNTPPFRGRDSTTVLFPPSIVLDTTCTDGGREVPGSWKARWRSVT